MTKEVGDPWGHGRVASARFEPRVFGVVFAMDLRNFLIEWDNFPILWCHDWVSVLGITVCGTDISVGFFGGLSSRLQVGDADSLTIGYPNVEAGVSDVFHWQKDDFGPVLVEVELVRHDDFG